MTCFNHLIFDGLAKSHVTRQSFVMFATKKKNLVCSSTRAVLFVALSLIAPIGMGASMDELVGKSFHIDGLNGEGGLGNYRVTVTIGQELTKHGVRTSKVPYSLEIAGPTCPGWELPVAYSGVGYITTTNWPNKILEYKFYSAPDLDKGERHNIEIEGSLDNESELGGKFSIYGGRSQLPHEGSIHTRVNVNLRSKGPWLKGP